MLTALSIRDVVLIDRLDLSFGSGLTVLTGETGSGKSILLDGLGLVLGARADSGLVRAGAEQAVVSASFLPEADARVGSVLEEYGFDAGEEIVLRRIVNRDGRSRAFVNDQSVSVGVLKRVASGLVEVNGQHEQISLLQPALHASYLDAFGQLTAKRSQVGRLWQAWRDAAAALESAQAAMRTAEREGDWLRHSVDELATLAPVVGEEETLTDRRRQLQMHDRQREAVAEAIAEITPSDRRANRPATALRAAARALQRLVPPGREGAENPADAALSALERAQDALSEAEAVLQRLASDFDSDPSLLDRTEERLFALRAAARKHDVEVAELPALLDQMAERLSALETNVARLETLETDVSAARNAYMVAARSLSEDRHAAAEKLGAALAGELAPLRLEKARFVVEVSEMPEAEWASSGIDRIQFLLSTNPGETPGPLTRVPSGGELSRLMLALKVVLSGVNEVPTIVLDEVDSGIGGATAAAVGERLVRLSTRTQILVVTHSPQVAACGAHHLRVTKRMVSSRMVTDVEQLTADGQKEEIARMLAGELISDAARAAATDLLGRR